MINVLINGIQIGNRSGTGRYTEELVKALLNIPENLLIYLCSSIKLTTASTRLNYINLPREKLLAKFLLSSYIKSFIDSHKVDIIHHPAFYGPISHEIPTLITVHDLAFLENPNWFPYYISTYYKITIPRSILRADMVITDSQYIAQQIKKHFNVPDAKIRTIYLGVSELFKPVSSQEISKIKEKYRLPSRYLLYLGTLEPRKNIPNMLRGWGKSFPTTRTPIVLIGRKGWKTGEIYKTINKSPYKEHIQLLGYVPDEDIPSIICGAEAFVYLSFYEGFGLPPLEAMKCGIPVIASNSGSLKEILSNYAILVNPNDVDNISESIVKIIEDETLKQHLVANGIIYANSFTWEKTAIETHKVYKQCIRKEKCVI